MHQRFNEAEDSKVNSRGFTTGGQNEWQLADKAWGTLERKKSQSQSKQRSGHGSKMSFKAELLSKFDASVNSQAQVGIRGNRGVAYIDRIQIFGSRPPTLD